MKNVFCSHFARYPQMQPQDAVKLAYQSVFGGGHMILDPGASLEYLRRELAATPQEGGAVLLEPIGGGLCRLHLGAVAASGLRAETVNGLFCYTANHASGTREAFEDRLSALQELADAGEAPFGAAALEEYLAAYREAGMPAVHHSEEFRRAYAPAYRLVPEATRALLPLLRAMDKAIAETGGVRVAIDGRCGSGKSTLGAMLGEIYSAALFHMDDFFLPFERKTPERLAEPGGNVDRERFWEEIGSKPLGEDVTYRPWNCQTGLLDAPVTVLANPVRVIEGSYSQHPALRGGVDLRVAVSIDPQTQKERILARNGAEKWKQFESRWIPLEEAYFAAVPVYEESDVVLRMD